MLRRLKSHHIVGTTSVALGLSFLTEDYSKVSRALRAPLEIMAWVPGVTSAQAWGALFVLSGLFILVSWNIWARALTLAFGCAFWAFFAVSGLYEGLLGPDAHITTCFVGILGSSIVAAFLRASAQVQNDFQRRR